MLFELNFMSLFWLVLKQLLNHAKGLTEIVWILKSSLRVPLGFDVCAHTEIQQYFLCTVVEIINLHSRKSYQKYDGSCSSSLSFICYLLHGMVKPDRPAVLMQYFRCRTAEFFVLLQAEMQTSGRKWSEWKFECSFLWSQMGVQLANCWMISGLKAFVCCLLWFHVHLQL